MIRGYNTNDYFPCRSAVGHKASSEAFVFKEIIRVEAKKPRTIIYIVGFNLYYGALKGTKYKWLDLHTLFHKLLGEHHTITEIKYFTARVSAREGDPDAPNRQDAYLKALETYIPNISTHYGHFLTNLVKAKVNNPNDSDNRC